MDEELRRAIAERRLIAFSYDGHRRIAEPHDFGLIDGEKKLFCYQVGGTSRSGRPLGWRWAVVAHISGLRLLDDRFPPAPNPVRTSPALGRPLRQRFPAREGPSRRYAIVTKS